MSDGHSAIVANGAEPSTVPDNNGTVPTGARREFTARVRALVAEAGDLVREELAQPEVARAWCNSLKLGIEARDRTAMNLYPQVMKLVGEERRITVEFIHSLGARSEGELRKYVEAAKSVEGAGPHDGAARCTDYLEAYLNLYPEQRASVVKRLGGLVAVG